MKIKFITLLFLMLIASIQFTKAQKNDAPNYFNVKQYGAVGDGINLDSKAINKAINAAAATGGGTSLYRQANICPALSA